MTKGRVETPSGEVLEVDFSGMEQRISANQDAKMKKYMSELKEYYEKNPKQPEGKGVIEVGKGTDKTKLLEALHSVARSDIKEQWTIVIPNKTQYEPAAHLRDYVFVSDVLKGGPGDTVNIPYVKDLDFSYVSGTAIGSVTGLVKYHSATIEEWGCWSDVSYKDIEKADQNVLDELNRVFGHAAVRAEDASIMGAMDGFATGSYAGATVLGTSGTAFQDEYVVQALRILLAAGKEVHPGDCVAYMTPTAYGDLLEQLVASQVIAYARGDVITKGIVEDFLGVKIVVGGFQPEHVRSTATGTYEACFIFRAKRAVALAPKRDILIETDRQIKERNLRIAGSHTFAKDVMDPSECVKIITSTAI